jgi:Cell division protein CrgA
MPKSRSKRVKRQPPPKPKPKRSPVWVPALFFTLLMAGVIIIIANYMGVFPDETSNPRLFYGLGLISGSFIVATQWH